MLHNLYVSEKLREFEAERGGRALMIKEALAQHEHSSKGKPVIGPVIRTAGRTLRWAGERLAGWAAPPPAETEQTLRAERRAG